MWNFKRPKHLFTKAQTILELFEIIIYGLIIFLSFGGFPLLNPTLKKWLSQIGILLDSNPITANLVSICLELISNRLILSIILLSLALPFLWCASKRPKRLLVNILEIIGFFLYKTPGLALSCYNKVIDICPKKSFWINRGVMLFRLERYEEAICSFDKAIEREPFSDAKSSFSIDDDQFWTYRGQTLAILKRYNEAIDSYDRVLELQPDCSQVLRLRGIALVQAKRHNEAVQTYDKLLQLQPKNVRFLLLKADTLLRLKQYDEASICYERALKLQPRNADIWSYRAELMRRWQRYEEALFSCKQAFKFAPYHFLTQCQQGMTLIELNRLDEALKLSQKLVWESFKDPVPLNIKGVALSRMGRAEEAIATFNQAIQLQPDNAESWYNKACHHAENEEVVEAVFNLQRAIELCSELADHLATDKSFDRIRDRKEFQQLLKNYGSA